MSQPNAASPGHPKKVLGPVQFRGVAVGRVISGEYFGWSYGWNTAGTLGFLVATVLVATPYTTFLFSYTELSTAISHAGGPFAYARRAFGPTGGRVAGFATPIEFVFGLIASFHGIVMGCSRQISALARAGYPPGGFAVLNARFGTPHRALLTGGAAAPDAMLATARR